MDSPSREDSMYHIITHATPRIITIVTLLLLAPITSIAWPGDDPPETTLSTQFEISGYPSSGRFITIRSLAVDDRNDTLYVLHDTPPVISAFSTFNGSSLKQHRLLDDISATATITVHDGELIIFTAGTAHTIGADGKLKSPAAAMPSAPVTIATSYLDILWAYDGTSQSLTRFRKGAPECSVNFARAKPSSRKIISLASSFPDKVYAFDSDRRSIHIFDNRCSYEKTVTTLETAPAPPAGQPPLPLIAIDGRFNIWTINNILASLDSYDTMMGATHRLQRDASGFQIIQSPAAIISAPGRNMLFVLDSQWMSIKAISIAGL